MRSHMILASLPAMGMAFPSLMGADDGEQVGRVFEGKRASAPELDLDKRQRGPLGELIGGVGEGVGDLVGGVLGIVTGLLGSVATAVDQNNLRPEPGFDFQPPGPNDSRGPCPALNLLANHGYLPRNGHVSFGEVLEATARGFNMGADLATVLCVFAVLTDGDPSTQRFFLGTDPATGIGGLNRHSTVEADISPNKEDYYLGCGDNHHISSNRFAKNVEFVAATAEKEFNYEAMRNHYANSASLTLEHNPYVYYFPFPSIVSVVAFNFYPEYFSNGTFGSGGVANYESVSSIIGAELDEETGNFRYVPERFPEQGWYRRSTPYGAVEALVDGFTRIYPANPVPMEVPQIGTGNLNASTFLCNVYQNLNAISPLALAPTLEQGGSVISWALDRLIDVGIEPNALGCPTTAISPNSEGLLFPNREQEGGPLNRPPQQIRNGGNNVYGQSYFCDGPLTDRTCDNRC